VEYQSAKSAVKAATRLTRDSTASERRPTDPVRKYAPNFRVRVIQAAAMESQPHFSSEVSVVVRA
jgi:hypothetical protein